MKVIDLLGDDFNIACESLSNTIILDNFNPNIVIGILTGGGVVGNRIYNSLAKHNNITYAEIKVQRENSKSKENKILSTLLKTFPRTINNILRILESKYLEYKSKSNNPKRVGDVLLSNEVTRILDNNINNNILLVDDAIDSGATLKLVADYINNKYPNNNIKIAVITITTKSTMIDADYYLYNNRTLIRFPWSNDV